MKKWNPYVKPPADECPEEFCFNWAPEGSEVALGVYPNVAESLKALVPVSEGMCRRLYPHPGLRDYYEPDEGEASTPPSRAKHQSRVRALRFPPDRSLGTILVRRNHDPAVRPFNKVWHDEWGERLEARGTVTILGDADVALFYTASDYPNLSPLASFQPDDWPSAASVTRIWSTYAVSAGSGGHASDRCWTGIAAGSDGSAQTLPGGFSGWRQRARGLERTHYPACARSARYADRRQGDRAPATANWP